MRNNTLYYSYVNKHKLQYFIMDKRHTFLV